MTTYQLLSLSALLIASKQHSKSCGVSAERLATASHGSYDAREVAEAEGVLLRGLDWDLCHATPWDFAAYLVALAHGALLADRNMGGRPRERVAPRRRRRQQRGRGPPDKDDPSTSPAAPLPDERTAALYALAKARLEGSVRDHRLSVLRRPSAVAAAAVLESMEVAGFGAAHRDALSAALVALGVRVAEELLRGADGAPPGPPTREPVDGDRLHGSRRPPGRSAAASTSSRASSSSSASASSSATRYVATSGGGAGCGRRGRGGGNQGGPARPLLLLRGGSPVGVDGDEGGGGGDGRVGGRKRVAIARADLRRGAPPPSSSSRPAPARGDGPACAAAADRRGGGRAAARAELAAAGRPAPRPVGRRRCWAAGWGGRAPLEP